MSLLIAPGSSRACLAAMASLLTIGLARAANETAPFYEGKTITMSVGVAPGGGYDLYARLAAEFLGRHIPGKPNILVVNMPGGGGLRAAVHLYNTAPKDGTWLCAIVQSVAFDSVLGSLPVPADRFNFIGRMTTSVETQLLWGTSPTRTIEDAKTRVTVLGATGASSPSNIVPKLLNNVLGTKFRIVLGYAGTQESFLAMERGEVEGTLKSVDSIMVSNRDMLEKGTVRVLWQLGLKRHPLLPQVPAIGELGDDEDGRAALRLIASTAEVGRSIATAPDVPAQRVQTLREAFARMIADPEMLEAARKRGVALEPAGGAAIQTIINETTRTPEQVIRRVKAALSAP